MDNRNYKVATTAILWIARIWGGAIILVALIAVWRGFFDEFDFSMDWRAILLYVGILAGYGMAYKWELVGGLLSSVCILASGFLHPLVYIPGLLYLLYVMLDRRLPRN